MASRFTYAQECCFCFKRFKRLRALEKHKETKHPEEGRSTDGIRFFDNEEDVVRAPEIKLMGRRSKDYKEGYLAWLGGLTEQINGSLHPGLRGQYRVYMFILHQ